MEIQVSFRLCTLASIWQQSILGAAGSALVQRGLGFRHAISIPTACDFRKLDLADNGV
jgi:hypothetical protein